MDLREEARKYALQNAVRYDGKASIGAVMGKLFSIFDKKKVKNNVKLVKDVIEEVNSMKVFEQKEELLEKAPELLEEKKNVEERKLPDLDNSSEIVMRFEPSPSGPLHIGHAYVLSLNSEYCKKYNGKLILRIGDTNPENIYPTAYKLIQEDADWVTKNNVSAFYIQSDRMEIYYSHMENLFDMNKAYVCDCDREEFKSKLDNKEACPCRSLSVDENKKRWKKMFDGYKQGEAVVRLKTDLEDKNPAMRDFPLFRINDSPHVRTDTKYRVWPLMNFSVAVDDFKMGVTHAIRAKDHADNAKRQDILHELFGNRPPVAISVGRINFEDMAVSCSKTRLEIDKGKYLGWDDIRLPFLRALKRRGYLPEAFINYALDVGISKSDKTVSNKDYFKGLNFFNREVVDSIANRYFFVWDTVKVSVVDGINLKVDLKKHPDFVERGERTFMTKGVFYLVKEDFESLDEGKIHRLMDCYNVVLKDGSLVFDSAEYEKYKENKGKIIHWLPEGDLVDVVVVMPDGDVIEGYGEEGLKELKTGDIIQFERFGFVRLDKVKEGKYIFWFGHK